MIKQVRDILIRKQSLEDSFGTRQSMLDFCKMPEAGSQPRSLRHISIDTHLLVNGVFPSLS
jgi:hypothetical protein